MHGTGRYVPERGFPVGPVPRTRHFMLCLFEESGRLPFSGPRNTTGEDPPDDFSPRSAIVSSGVANVFYYLSRHD